MKFGVRTPSIKRSIKARTTGRIKRSIKSSINPLYGKKGMGYINNPQKAIYNKIYRKTTVSSLDLLKPSSRKVTDNVSWDEVNIQKNYVLLDSGICGPLIAVSMLPTFLFWLIGGFVQLFSPGMGGMMKAIAYLLIFGDVICLIRMIYVEYMNKKTIGELNHKINRQLTKEEALNLEQEMKSYFEYINEHFDKMVSCKDYADFVYEYTYIKTILKEAINIEKLFIIESGTPSEILKNLELKKPLLINDIIDTQYVLTKDKMLSLKTEKAKLNNANKFLETFETYFDEFPNECTEYVHQLYDELKKMCEKQ